MTEEYTYKDLDNIKPTPHFQYNCMDALEYFSNDMKSTIMDHISKEKWPSWDTHFDTRLQELEDVLECAVSSSINNSKQDEDIEWCKIVSKIITTEIRKTFDTKNKKDSVCAVIFDVLGNDLFADYVTFDCINCDKDSGDNSGDGLCPECEEEEEDY